METNKNKCVILKPSEYKELKEKAEAKKPDRIEIWINIPYTGDYVKSSIDFSESLYAQIRRIMHLLTEKFYKNIEIKDEVIDKIRNNDRKELANLSKKERNKILKQYKNK